jgi:ATP-dependent DNA helicase RecG
MDFVRRNSKKAWRKATDRRLEYPEYPERAVEEGLVNALIHRNYLELGSEVHIDMYDDRLEIYSPGGLMDGGSIKDMDLMNMASRRRNPVLADIFSRLKYMERRGSGFRKIMLAYKTHDGYTEGMEPTFTPPWDSFVLTLPKFNIEGVDGVEIINEDGIESNNEQGGQKSGQKSGQKGGQKTIDIIRQLIKDDPTITRNAIAEIIGISPSAIQKHINRLKEDNVIVRQGGDRGGFWKVLEN